MENGIGKPLEGKRVLVTGGTGSLGQRLIRRILSGDAGRPAKIVVFSRDEAKQHEMRLRYKQVVAATDEIIYHNFEELLQFRIGDIRDLHSVSIALRDSDIVFNTAALKQVPTCEYFPEEAVSTNVLGAKNLVRAVEELDLPVETVIGISTDKACKPVNVMGMTKALQERLLVQANLRRPATRFACVRYGNVLTSRGSVIPLFLSQIAAGGPVTITRRDMTRFLLTLDQAVDTVLTAVSYCQPGEIFVPLVSSANVVDLADALIAGREIDQVETGVRPGEKIHEILVSEEECHRTIHGPPGYLAIQPILPELQREPSIKPAIDAEYSSADNTMDRETLREYLAGHLPGEVALSDMST
jgi:FlaA1/EpsC-like NDP-sugar epimerase